MSNLHGFDTDSQTEKVGEILLANGQLIFYCSICQAYYYSYELLQEHLYSSHFQIETELQTQDDDNQETLIVEESMSENLIFEEIITPDTEVEDVGNKVENDNDIDDNDDGINIESKCIQTILLGKSADDYKILKTKSIIKPEMGIIKPEHLEIEPDTPYPELLLKNMEIVDDEKRVRPYVCEICAKAFNLKHHLVQHRLIHTGERQFQCQFCQKAFAFKYGLNRHLQRIHMVPKPFRCSSCDAFFGSKDDIDGHACTLNKVKNHKCDQCHKSYGSLWELTRHKKSHYRKFLLNALKTQPQFVEIAQLKEETHLKDEFRDEEFIVEPQFKIIGAGFEETESQFETL